MLAEDLLRWQQGANVRASAGKGRFVDLFVFGVAELSPPRPESTMPTCRVADSSVESDKVEMRFGPRGRHGRQGTRAVAEIVKALLWAQTNGCWRRRHVYKITLAFIFVEEGREKRPIKAQ